MKKLFTRGVLTPGIISISVSGLIHDGVRAVAPSVSKADSVPWTENFSDVSGGWKVGNVGRMRDLCIF